MIKLLLLTTSILTSAFGSTPEPEAFCRDYLALRQEQVASRPGFDQTLQILFSPKSLIRARQLDRALPAAASSSSPDESRKVAFVLLGAPESDATVVSAIRATKERIRRLPLIRDLARTESVEACIHAVREDAFGFARMSDYLDQYKQARPHLDAHRQKELRSLVVKKLGVFRKKGWEVRFPATYFDLLVDLQNDRRIREALVIAHADPEGKLYDATGTSIPKGFLLNLPEHLRKIILFSCHSRAVLEHYEAGLASSALDIHFPELEKRYENLYRTSIPVVALRGMLASAEASVSSDSAPERACKIGISFPAASGRYEILLQNRLIGILDGTAGGSTAFDCSLLGTGKIIFKLHHAEGEARIPPRVSEMRLTTPGTGMVLLRVKEFVSSDGTRHIQTIGTTGGHP